MVELLEGIGHNIRRLREEKGWNQTELGFHADTSPSIISLIENAKRNPSTATLAKIAGALGVEVVELFPKASGRSSPPEPKLFNGPEDERHPSVFAAVLIAAAERLAHVEPPQSVADVTRTFGKLEVLYSIAEPLLDLTDDVETWEHRFSESERKEILDAGIKLHQVGKQLFKPASEYLDRQHEDIEDHKANRQAEKAREQMREWTQRISA